MGSRRRGRGRLLFTTTTCAHGNAAKRRSGGGRCTRRTVLRVPMVATAGAVGLLGGKLGDSVDIDGEFSELAGKISGLGQADVYFPKYVLGEWQVERELYSVDTDADRVVAAGGDAVLGAEAVSGLRCRIGQGEQFRIRFYRHRGRIVEDRAYNTRNEVGQEIPGVSISARWHPDNPNVVTVAAGAMIREIHITKRAFVEAPNGTGTFFASEYATIVDTHADGALIGVAGAADAAATHVSGWRRVSRYRVTSVREVESEDLLVDQINRLTVDYRYAADEGEPVVTLKYREFLKRLK